VHVGARATTAPRVAGAVRQDADHTGRPERLALTHGLAAATGSIPRSARALRARWRTGRTRGAAFLHAWATLRRLGRQHQGSGTSVNDSSLRHLGRHKLSSRTARDAPGADGTHARRASLARVAQRDPRTGTPAYSSKRGCAGGRKTTRGGGGGGSAFVGYRLCQSAGARCPHHWANSGTCSTGGLAHQRPVVQQTRGCVRRARPGGAATRPPWPGHQSSRVENGSGAGRPRRARLFRFLGVRRDLPFVGTGGREWSS